MKLEAWVDYEYDLEGNCLEITLRRQRYTVDLLPGVLKDIMEQEQLGTGEQIDEIKLYFSPPSVMWDTLCEVT
jgi:hypothetical protein